MDTKIDRKRERKRERTREKFTFNKSFYGNGINKMVLIIIATRRWFSLPKKFRFIFWNKLQKKMKGYTLLKNYYHKNAKCL